MIHKFFIHFQLLATYYCSEIISSLHYIRNYQLCFTDWTNILPGTHRGAFTIWFLKELTRGLKSKKENPSSGRPQIKMAGKMCLPAVGTIKTNAALLCFSYHSSEFIINKTFCHCDMCRHLRSSIIWNDVHS
jgi:hypothetical protein